MMTSLSIFHNPALTVALALGMIVQAVAHHLRIPGIVRLLAAGVSLGPDGAGIIEGADSSLRSRHGGNGMIDVAAVGV